MAANLSKPKPIFLGFWDDWVIRKEFKEHIEKFYWKPLFWSSSYYVASSGGAPIDKLRQYIKEQNAPTE